jgi:hypothetical protein
VSKGWIEGTSRTFDKLATVDLAGCDLEGDDVALSAISTRAEQRPGSTYSRLVQELNWDSDCAGHIGDL